MDEKHRQILRQNRTLLVNNLYDIHNICEDLYSCDILTESMRSEIMAESTPIKQSRKLLDIVPKRGTQAFQSFLEALVNNGQKELASKLDPSLATTLMSNVSSNPPSSIQSTKQPLAENLEANKSTSIITSTTSENPSVVGITGQETGFQAVHGPKGVQPADVRGHKELHRQESSSQPASGELCSIKEWVEKLDLTFGSKDFSILPLSDSKPRHHSQSHKHYSMPEKPKRGLMIIIRNQHFRPESKLPDKPHACNNADFSRLDELFENLGFKIVVQTNLDLQKTREILKKEADKDHSEYDCFVLAILSHGKGGFIYTVDGHLISILEITEIFNDTGAPSLKGKPKIFIIQATEHSADMNRHDSSSSDLVDLTGSLADLKIGAPKNVNVTDTKQDVVELPGSPDMLVVLGTAGYSISHGSYFIQVLAYYICYLVHDCHLLEIIEKVNNLEVVDKDKELCVYKSSLTKELYFFTTP